MVRKSQVTRLNKTFGKFLDRLEAWSTNPWRRSSLLLIVLLVSFLIGSSIGVISGVLALFDPVGALITVLLLESMVRLRFNLRTNEKIAMTRQLLDFSRIGLLYGLLLEGFKLL